MHVDKVNSPTCRLKSNHAIGNVAAASPVTKTNLVMSKAGMQGSL